jgi:BR serine/threonine kinase
LGVILYALTVGRLPFDHDNMRKLLEIVFKCLTKIKLGTFDIPDFVTDGPRDLIMKMLNLNPESRPTVHFHLI